MKHFSALVLILLCVAVAHSQTPKKAVWNFKNLEGWVYKHQDNNPNTQCEVNKGVLKIFTTANSRDRKKLRTDDKVYTTGCYTWRIYIPQMGVGDQASVAGFIYNDDKHEIDYEVGYGKAAVREKLGAEADDMVAYCTTQAHPFVSVPVLVKTGWHTFEIDLSMVNGNYFVQWIIDGKVVNEVQQTYGKGCPFYIYCSVENLLFIGDHIPTQDNYGLFDYVKYKFHR